MKDEIVKVIAEYLGNTDWAWRLPASAQSDKIAAGVKKEEYREVKSYWIKRLIGLDKFYLSPGWCSLPIFDRIEFRNGYKPDSPRIVVEWLGLEVGTPNPEWFPKNGDLKENVFILKLGKVL
jgi:hypothetical protein